MSDLRAGRPRYAPVICAEPARRLIGCAWLSSQTGAEYRLPSEAEWEYAARAGTATKYSWGNAIGVNLANCDDWGSGGCGSQWDGNQTAPVGSFGANGFGLYDMHGNVWEWVEDCWNASYVGAPSDASPWLRGDCAKRVLRGGSWILRGASVPRTASGCTSRVPERQRRFPGGPDACPLSLYVLTPFEGFQGGFAPPWPILSSVGGTGHG